MEEIKIKKKNLISLLENTETYLNPKVNLEQYTIDAVCAVDIVFFAGVEFNDIQNKIVCDLGAGTGRLSIASAYLGANYVFSIDIDGEALNVLLNNTKKSQVDHLISAICCHVDAIPLRIQDLYEVYEIITIMNPPFGVQTKGADRIFLKNAMAFSEVIYSIHLANTKVQNFIKAYVREFEWQIDYILPYRMILEQAFPFHTKKRKEIKVDVYRLIEASPP
jgi:putative methylase